MKTLRQILEVSQNALAAMKRMADDPRTPIHQRDVAASMYARHNQSSDLASRTQGWGNSRNSSLFDEEGEVRPEHMENHEGILKYHKFQKVTMGHLTPQTDHYFHPSTQDYVMVNKKNGKINTWEHGILNPHSQTYSRSYGMMADTLHDSLKKRNY